MLLHWGIVFLFLSALVFWKTSRQIPVLYSATLLYLLITANAVICFRVLGAREVYEQQLNFLLSTSSFSAFAILLFGFASLCAEEMNSKKILQTSLSVIAPIGAVLFLVFKVRLLPHNSSSATLIALGLPYFIPESKRDWPKLFIVALVIASSVWSNTSSPLGVTSVILFSFFALNRKLPLGLALLSLLPIVLGAGVYGADYVFNDTNRFKAYETFMGYWWRDFSWNILFGYGPGSFEIVSQVIQHKTSFMFEILPNGKPRGELWLHMHSDWLQFLWEYGVIGLGLIVGCAIKLFRDLKEHPKERVILVGCMASGLFDFPCRYPAIPLVLFFLFGLSLCRGVTRR